MGQIILGAPRRPQPITAAATTLAPVEEATRHLTHYRGVAEDAARRMHTSFDTRYGQEKREAEAKIQVITDFLRPQPMRFSPSTIQAAVALLGHVEALGKADIALYLGGILGGANYNSETIECANRLLDAGAMDRWTDHNNRGAWRTWTTNQSIGLDCLRWAITRGEQSLADREVA